MFITSAGSERTAVDVFRIGAIDYVKQPVDLIVLRNTVKNLLEVQRSDSWPQWCRKIASQVIATSNCTGHDVPPHILRCITYIKENLSSPISLDNMAREGGLSKSYFCREFKKTMGMTPMHFLSRLRIKRSKDLLRKNIPISAIAMNVGFNDLSSFNRHFRDMVGQTPTDFRKSHCPD
ncbi:DNA-binding response regulator [Geomonas oryzisoli]|uniref:DNA-binding response regulator n=2 Tax=Geomonas oryzisoli TaxID=2847992 RepID=A0ABX8JB93_9BACT|nr:DNA-binding response regulator [Geomonas oryzisoli]